MLRLQVPHQCRDVACLDRFVDQRLRLLIQHPLVEVPRGIEGFRIDLAIEELGTQTNQAVGHEDIEIGERAGIAFSLGEPGAHLLERRGVEIGRVQALFGTRFDRHQQGLDVSLVRPSRLEVPQLVEVGNELDRGDRRVLNTQRLAGTDLFDARLDLLLDGGIGQGMVRSLADQQKRQARD